jgi:dienelactone hydrolase
MLHHHLLERARERLNERREAVASLKTPEKIQARTAALRAFFRESLGDLPASETATPLNAKVVGRLERDGYRIEKVIFESRPGHRVTAALYLPNEAGEGKPRVPGILFPCGHSANGKAAEPYQRACILLARNGMAVLCYDPIGQGERVQLLNQAGKPAVGGGTTEHTFTGIGAMLVGWQAATFRVWDGMRALDYLASRPEVDPERLGCTGNSGGGTMTAYLMALDDRIAAAAPSCYITSFERLLETIGPQDAEQNITGQIAAGLDHADYVTMRAPKPTLLSVGTQDFFDIQGSWNTFREVKLIYGRFGYGERVDLFESDEPHGFTHPRRVAAARWLRRWLLKEDDAIEEPEVPIATDAELQCTQTGQVLSEPDSNEVSVFDLISRRAEELASHRRRSQQATADELRAKVHGLLGFGDYSPTPKPLRYLGEMALAADQEGLGKSVVRASEPRFGEPSDFRGTTVRRWSIETEPGIVLPLVELIPPKEDRSKPIVVRIGSIRVDDEKAVTEVARSGDFQRQSRRVVLVDPRGLGATTPLPKSRSEARWNDPFGPDAQEAFLSLLLARPLLGQRVADVLTVLESLAAGPSAHREGEKAANHDGSPKSETRGYHVEANGIAGPIALHAALLDERGRIAGLSLERSLISWQSVIASPINRGQLGQVVPGALTAYDLPELAESLAPRPLSIKEPVDARGEPVSAETVTAIFAGCRAAYDRKGETALRIQASR